jgi:hypothetical protein
VIQVAPLPSPYAHSESVVIDPRYRDKVRSLAREEADANLGHRVVAGQRTNVGKLLA